MLRIGIVGSKRSDLYISAVESLNCIDFIGVFDPSFQFEPPKNIAPLFVYYSFSELVKKVDAIIFSSAEKIYLPLIESAIKYSKAVFLKGVYNLSLTEQHDVLKLHSEAREVVQIESPIIINDEFNLFLKKCENPLLLEFNFSDSNEQNLLLKLRGMLSVVLPLFKSNVRKTAVNIFSACREVPDILKIRIDFDNGSIAELNANCIGHEKQFSLKCIEYNGYYNFDLLQQVYVGEKNNEPMPSKSQNKTLTQEQYLADQISNFYYNISQFKTPMPSLENELNSQKIIELVKEKLRININIF